jgi:hypothetical protein
LAFHGAEVPSGWVGGRETGVVAALPAAAVEVAITGVTATAGAASSAAAVLAGPCSAVSAPAFSTSEGPCGSMRTAGGATAGAEVLEVADRIGIGVGGGEVTAIGLELTPATLAAAAAVAATTVGDVGRREAGV